MHPGFPATSLMPPRCFLFRSYLLLSALVKRIAMLWLILDWKHQFSFFFFHLKWIHKHAALSWRDGDEWSIKNLLAYLMVLRTRKRTWWFAHSAGRSLSLTDALKAWSTILKLSLCYSGCNACQDENSVSEQIPLFRRKLVHKCICWT